MPARRTFDRDQVAAIVLEAIDLGLPIIQTVMGVLDAGENQARHMVRMARIDGLLGTGEHRPARAVIHRGSGNEKTWTVCQECTTQWPCRGAYPFSDNEMRGPDTDDQAPPAAGRRSKPAGR